MEEAPKELNAKAYAMTIKKEDVTTLSLSSGCNLGKDLRK